MSAARPVAVLLAAVLLAVAALPLAAAQGIEEPLLERTGAKADAATADPVAYAGEQLSEEALADDVRWSVAYACYAKMTVEEESGIGLPEVDRCAGFEEAIGIAEEEAEEAEEAVADATELGDDVQAEAEALVEETDALAEAILDDPTDAPEAVLAFLDAALRDAGRIAGTALAIVGGILVVPFAGPAWLGQEAVLGALIMLDDAAATAATTGAAAIDAVDDATGAAAAAITGAVDSTGAAVGSFVAEVAAAVDAAIDTLLGGEPGRADAADRGLAKDPTGISKDADRLAGDMVDDVGDLGLHG